MSVLLSHSFHNKLKLIICFLFAFSFSADADDTKLYFHWGSRDGNRAILEHGNYPDTELHSQEINHGVNASLNKEVLQQLDDWNKASGSVDAAGSGFYVSSDLFDSRSFGNELLIVEVPHESMSDVKKYNNNWHVINSTSPKEIKFRRPTAKDVATIWENISPKTQKRVSFLNKIAKQLLITEKGLSRSAEIAFERLLFDEGKETLSKHIEEIIESKKVSAKMLEQFNPIFKVYLKKAAGSPITSKLLSMLYQKNPMYLSNEIIDVTKHGFKNLSSKDKKFFLERFTDGFGQSGQVIREYEKFIELFPVVNEDLSKQQRKQWVKFFTATIDNLPVPVEDQKTFKIIRDTLGPEISFELAKQNFTQAFNELINERSSYKHVASDFKRTKANFKEVDRALVMLTSPPFDSETYLRFVKEELKKISKAGSQNANTLTLFLLKKLEQRIGKLPFEKELLDLSANTSVSTFSNNKENSSFMRNLFQDVLETDITSKQFETLILNMSKDFPALNTGLTNMLIAESSSVVNQKKGKPISYSRIIQRIEDNKTIEQIEAEILHAAKSKAIKASNPLSTDDIKRVLLTVPTSKEYSQLSRTFSLVDPIFVSEDIRVMNATQPWKRFNESYVIQGKSYIQPTWENYGLAWDEYPQLFNTSSSQFSAIHKTHKTIMNTNVDGYSLKEVNGKFLEEARDQFTTFISNDEWKQMSTDNHREDLAQFFTIEDKDDGKTLKFKSVKELSKSVPWITQPIDRGQAEASYLLSAFGKKQLKDVKDPIKRATKILYYFTKLHPFSNGNGRLARLWATQELLAAGHPIPVGLPTNDFLMSEKRIELEVKKSLQLGRMWEDMINEAHKKKVPPESFFQKVFKGSTLEGLIHVEIPDEKKLEKYIAWLETQEKAPDWGKDYLKLVENEINQTRATNGSLAHVSESQRYSSLANAWEKFNGESKISVTKVKGCRLTPAQVLQSLL